MTISKVKVPMSTLENCLDRIASHTEEARILLKCCGVESFYRLVGKIGLITEWGKQLQAIDLEYLGMELKARQAIEVLVEHKVLTLEAAVLEDCINSINILIPNALTLARRRLHNQYNSYKEFS